MEVVTNLLVISSPQHYYSFLEYFNAQKIIAKDTIILVTYSKDFGNDQSSFVGLEKEASKWKEVIFFELWSRKTNLIERLKVVGQFKKLIRKNLPGRVHRMVVSQYNTNYVKHIANTILYKELICLDEGNAVFAHAQARINNLNGSGGQKTLKDRILGFRNNEVSEVTYFTKYDINVSAQDKLIRYSSSFLELKSIDETRAVIIGAPYIADKIFSKQYYFDLLSLIVSEFPTDQKFTYFSHRRETAEQLSEIENFFKMEINNSVVPVEIKIDATERWPKAICGIYSSAILNLKQVIPNQEVMFCAVSVDPSEVLRPDLLVSLESIYKTFAQSGIRLLNQEVV